MSHRTYGETRDCKGCRYWSEMIAKSHGSGVLALCLNSIDKSPLSHVYTNSFQTCKGWANGEHGAIDEPGQDPDAYDMEPA